MNLKFWHGNCNVYNGNPKPKPKEAKMKNKKGFTLIELMIVVVIIGILAALAIPRFMAASKKAKIAEAEGILKQIYTQAEVYYQAEGQYPEAHTFNEGNKDDWNDLSGVAIDAPSGEPRFGYEITTGGTEGFAAEATTENSYDQSLKNDNITLSINQRGQITK